MPPFKPARKLGLQGNLGLNPEKSADYFIESQQQEKLLVKPPNWCLPGNEIELLALQNKCENLQMLQLQHTMLEDVKQKSINNSKRLDEIITMQNEIRERMIRANDFFKDFDTQKRLAETTISHEKQLHMELKTSITTVQENTEVMTKFYEDLKSVITQLEPYRAIMEEVVVVSNDCSSIEDCMKKCDSLMITQAEVCELQKNKLQEIESIRLEMIKLTDKAKLALLGLNSELSELERTSAQVHSECLRLENIIGDTKDCLIDHKTTKRRIIDGITIMYRLVCKRRGLSPIFSEEDVEKRLDFIKEEIEILRDVIKECLKN
ncbi:uncharacterized protein LOC129946408 isoform X1 [Eupeodes corollae]|uniref:uncharacterized protein LOC129946408 isoform X1 n=1 Tax=Eupeodes corollae TaxID=290404 RepID=UPI002492F624|nr:uncharacterized protein LOC129946408 isoform X1 [Eupeodes corollae]XP_055912561.1 uncharacterized protein LOC129946408 isoform X1 [Eupeodes corollae]XP_055912562.1 uncharacterized protein LOC129946408 isoform X1 [Eupeodes corollae]